jgi:prophage antirepressor-like protein
MQNEDNTNLLVKEFNGLNIEVHGTYEQPLFKAKDIGDLLEMKNIREVIKNFNNKQRCDVSLTDAIGREQNTTFLTEQGLYKLLMRSRKPIAEQFQDWVCEVIEEIRKKGKYELEEQLKTKELELTKYKEKIYEEIEKTGHVYVIKMDGGYKVGKTKDAVIKRVRGMQTANVNNIMILLDYECSNADLLEKCVHYILERYRCNNNREFFDCNVDYIIEIVNILGGIIDTLKSTYQHIPIEDMKHKIEEKLIINLNYDNALQEENNEGDKNRNVVLRTCYFCNTTYSRKESLIRHLKDNSCLVAKSMTLLDFHNKIVYGD